MDIRRFVGGYVADVKALLDEVDPVDVEAIVDALLGAWRGGGRVLLMGNGGSSSSVSHIVNDMQKNIALESGRPLRALCLSDCTPLMMAWANDTEWDNVFAPQVECWAEPGDVVIGVSGSGNSMNVINGIATARRAGAITVGLAGFQGGKLREAAERCVIVRSDNMQRIEDVHMILLHVIFSALLEQTKREAVTP
ncbi:MAG TPA: SIS domain-containing protein [Chthonomonadaceae bacterium]|nr:SIS domain-containing protein [Chthonomonadaceae bacterium]